VAIAAASLDVRSGGLVFVSGVLGVIIVLPLVVALVLGRPGWFGVTPVLLALLYLGHVLVAPGSDLATAGLVGVALLLVGELSQWSFDSRVRGHHEAAIHRSRALGVGGLALLGAGAVVLSLLVVGLPVSGGLVTVIVGVTAFVGVVALVSFVAVRSGSG
jgi:hypothetical protein